MRIVSLARPFATLTDPLPFWQTHVRTIARTLHTLPFWRILSIWQTGMLCNPHTKLPIQETFIIADSGTAVADRSNPHAEFGNSIVRDFPHLSLPLGDAVTPCVT